MRLHFVVSVAAVTLGALAACGKTSETATDAGDTANGGADGAAADGSSGGGSPAPVGRACVPEDETVATFSGFSASEVNVEIEPRDCGAGQVCLANHFQGRVSCPYGQSAGGGGCVTPGSGGSSSASPVTVGVTPQLLGRRAADTVICSCLCAGPDTNADYCACPGGFVCAELIDDLGLGKGDLAGSYCIPEGTLYDKTDADIATCDAAKKNCEP